MAFATISAFGPRDDPFGIQQAAQVRPVSGLRTLEMALAYLCDDTRKKRLAQIVAGNAKVEEVGIIAPFSFDDGQRHKYQSDRPYFDGLLEVITGSVHYLPIVIDQKQEGIFETLRRVNYLRNIRLQKYDFVGSEVIFVRWSKFSEEEVTLLKANNIIPILLGEEFVKWGQQAHENQIPAKVETF